MGLMEIDSAAFAAPLLMPDIRLSGIQHGHDGNWFLS
jgi:hypothetical protein